MIKFVRSFFGLNGPSTKRAVIGSTNNSFDLQQVAYIKDSTNRLATLLDLSKKYKGTAHEENIKKVHEKTKKIHSFLVSKRRIHELELFHIQNTDHFINTFSLIIEVHHSHKESAFAALEVEPEVASIKEPVVQAPLPKVESSNGKNKGELFEIAEKVRQRSKQGSVIYAEEAGTQVPTLAVPEVSINTIAKVFFHKEDTSGKPVPYEISFVSTQEEKEAFQAFVSARLGLKDIYYVGNASINLSHVKSSSPKEMAPVIYWGKNLYALTLQDYRMFPVTINRKSL
jgi:hypothetical protein